MTIEDLRVFVAVCETRSLSAAGRQLGCSQSAVSHHVKRLELEYGTALLTRHRSGVEVTPAGRAVLDAADTTMRALRGAREAVRLLSEHWVTTLRVGTVAGGTCPFLIDTIAKMGIDHPDTRIELVVRPRARDVIAELRGGGVEAVYTGLGPALSGLEQRALARSHWVVLVHKTHPWARRDRLEVDDLSADEAQLLTPLATQTFLNHQLTLSGAQLGGVTTVDDREYALRLVELGLHQAIMPSVWAPTIPDALSRVGLPWIEPINTGWIVRRWDQLSATALEMLGCHDHVVRTGLHDHHVELFDPVLGR